MKFGLISLVIASAALALPAVADQSVPEAQMQLDAPKSSETSRAAPDWYKRFSTEAETSATRPAWQTEPDNRDIAFDWGTNGRWKIRFDMKSRSVESPLPREEVSAGANFQLTPRFSFGGQFSVGANELDDTSQWEDQQIEAGVRLQSAFKF